MNKKSINIALFEPEIAQNVGAILRTASCFDVKVHIIEPCGFVWNSNHMKRAGMDYIDTVDVIKHNSLKHFLNYCNSSGLNIVICSTKGDLPYYKKSFTYCDIVLFGKESAGLPNELMNSYPKITIPMKKGKRSLNLAISCGIIMSNIVQSGY